MGCGGILGVNLGSVDEPRLIRMTYRPARAHRLTSPGGQGDHVRLRRHQPQAERRSRTPQMKNDMTGAGGDPRRDDRARRHWTARSPSRLPVLHRQHAVGLGDEAGRRAHHAQRHDRRGAQHRRRGPTGDGRRPVLAVEDGVDAIVDIATLTGACLRTPGRRDRRRDRQRRRAWSTSSRPRRILADEPVWRAAALPPLPSAARLDDRRHDQHGRRSTAGRSPRRCSSRSSSAETPWAHVDIAGTAQQPAVRTWRNKGASGFGAKLLIELATGFAVPRRVDR